jgi:hypothetical protein
MDKRIDMVIKSKGQRIKYYILLQLKCVMSFKCHYYHQYLSQVNSTDRLVRFPPWSGIFFKLARCGYTLRVTSQASYSPEYITPTQKNHDYC